LILSGERRCPDDLSSVAFVLDVIASLIAK